MTQDELDERGEGMHLDDPIARLIRAGRPRAPVGLAERVLAASVTASHAALRRRRAVAAAAGSAVAIAAVVAVVGLRPDEPRPVAVPAGPTPPRQSPPPATRTVSGAPITSWGNAAMLVAQRLAPHAQAILACRRDHAPYALRLEVRVDAKLLGEVGAANAVRATVIGSRPPTAAERCVDHVLAGVALPELPPQLRVARISLAISPDEPATITVPAASLLVDEPLAEQRWADPVGYALSMLGSEFSPKPGGGTALGCLSKGRHKLDPPRGTDDLVFIAERGLRYLLPAAPTKVDRCLEAMTARVPTGELPAGVDQLELAFARPSSAR
jgi:hypothetical protein